MKPETQIPILMNQSLVIIEKEYHLPDVVKFEIILAQPRQKYEMKVLINGSYIDKPRFNVEAPWVWINSEENNVIRGLVF